MSPFHPLPPRHNTAAAAQPPADPPEALRQAAFVFVRRDGHRPPLTPAYDGPFKVLQRSRHTFKLQMGPRVDVVSTHRLKPAFTGPAPVPAVPPRRGRPPAAAPVPGPTPTPPPAVPVPAPPAPVRVRRVRFAPAPVVIPAAPPAAAALLVRPGRLRRPPDRWGSAMYSLCARDWGGPLWRPIPIRRNGVPPTSSHGG